MNLDSKYIFANWKAPKSISALATTRIGGFSHNPYDQFNLALHVGDDEVNVIRNRKLLKEELQLPNEPVWLNQIHSNIALCVDENSSSAQADASITQQINTVLAIMTADCLPILICNRAGTEIAAIHGGWRGLLAGVIDKTITQLQSPPHELIAWFGPAIGPDAFEVNSDIRQSFVNKHANYQSCFFQPAPKRYFSNIFDIARVNLNLLGIQKIYSDDICTAGDFHRFYSYRRDKGKTGRMASLIWIAS